MTRFELDKINDIINESIKQENEYAERYIKNNPTDAQRRNHMRDIANIAIYGVWAKIKDTIPVTE